MTKLISMLSWLVKLKVVPGGWLVYLTGFTALLLGVTCALDVHQLPGLDLPCPEDPWAFIVGGAGAIGFRRALDK